MIFKQNSQSLLTVSALAVDQPGFRLAVYATKPTALDQNDESFIFLMDAESGESASGMLITNGFAAMGAHSSGMLLQSDGTVLLALNLAHNNVNFSDLRLRVASFDPINGSSQVLGLDDNFKGHSAALARGANESLVYLGGSYKSSNDYNLWKLALARLPNSQDDKFFVTTFGYILNYDKDVSCNNEGHWNSEQAPYISHMASMQDLSGQTQLFGLARGEKCGEEEGKSNERGACGVVWRVGLDGAGETKEDLKSKRIMSMNHGSYFVGMRDRMDYDSTS